MLNKIGKFLYTASKSSKIRGAAAKPLAPLQQSPSQVEHPLKCKSCFFILIKLPMLSIHLLSIKFEYYSIGLQRKALLIPKITVVIKNE